MSTCLEDEVTRTPFMMNNVHQTESVETKPNDINGTVPTATRRMDYPHSPLMKLKTYLLAVRPWSLSASLVPTMLGTALAYKSNDDYNFSFLTFVLTTFTIITVHGAGNVVNTYFDYVKGIDNRKSDDRTLVDHILSKDEVILNNLVLNSLINL